MGPGVGPALLAAPRGNNAWAQLRRGDLDHFWKGLGVSAHSKTLRFYMLATAVWLATLGAVFAQNSYPVIAAVFAMD
jgi:hypothetical protein